jgi:hypothetical protein
MNFALEEAERERASPVPVARDIIDLHLNLGTFVSKAGDMKRAIEHYQLACESEDPEQANQGQFGHLKAQLGSLDGDETRQLLRRMLAAKDDEPLITAILKLTVRDDNHDGIVSTIFTAAEVDHDLLQAIVRAMEAATLGSSEIGERVITANVPVSDPRFVQDEIRGVLYYRGVAAYTYGVAPAGRTNDRIEAALALWQESRSRLAGVGDHNAPDCPTGGEGSAYDPLLRLSCCQAR